MVDGLATRGRSITNSLLAATAALAMAGGVAAGIVAHFDMQARADSALKLPELYGQVVWPAAHRRAPGFSLRDQHGAMVWLARQSDHAVLLAFIDPRCVIACRSEGLELAAVQREAAPAARPALLIVSVDPHATAEDAVTAARAWGLGKGCHWLVGGIAQLEPVWRAYGVGRSASRVDGRLCHRPTWIRAGGCSRPVSSSVRRRRLRHPDAGVRLSEAQGPGRALIEARPVRTTSSTSYIRASS